MKLQWQEPAEYFRAYMLSTGTVPSRWQRMVWGCIAAAVVGGLILGFEWFFFLLHKKDLGVPTYAYFVGPAISGLFIYWLPGAVLTIPATIVLTEKGLFRNKAFGSELQVTCWPWETITELALDKVRYGDQEFPVLAVTAANEPAEILIGLGTASIDEIEMTLHQVGKKLVRRKL